MAVTLNHLHHKNAVQFVGGEENRPNRGAGRGSGDSDELVSGHEIQGDESPSPFASDTATMLGKTPAACAIVRRFARPCERGSVSVAGRNEQRPARNSQEQPYRCRVGATDSGFNV